MTKKDLKIFRKIPSIKTDRLILRKICKKDIDDVFEYASDPEVSKYLLWSPHKSKEYTVEYLKYINKLYRKCDFFDWGIEFEGKMIGTVGFSHIFINENCAEIGYVLNRAFWGRGIACEAVNAIVSFAFEKLKISCLKAVFIQENDKSRRLLKSLGFEAHEKTYEMNIKGQSKTVEEYFLYP